MRCSRCNAENPVGMRFCGQCAAPLGGVCPACGAANPPENRFCGSCAAPLDAYHPPGFAEAAPKAPGFAGELKQVSVLFCDIVGSTALTERLGAEAMHDLVNRFLEVSIAEIRRYDGTVPQFAGDGFMAIFGAPLPDPAAARHAVAAAREILAEIDRRGLANRPWPLKVGIGLHLGPAVTGNVGSPRRKEFTAIGDTVNLASRLEQLTKTYAARLIISEAVLAGLGSSAGTATPLGAVAVKGYAEPVPIWRLE